MKIVDMYNYNFDEYGNVRSVEVFLLGEIEAPSNCLQLRPPNSSQHVILFASEHFAN